MIRKNKTARERRIDVQKKTPRVCIYGLQLTAGALQLHFSSSHVSSLVHEDFEKS